jgi:uncharacterized protein (DUF2225 family)
MGLDDKLVRKKLEVLLKEETLVETYLRTYGPRLDMNYVAKVKAAHQKTASGDGAAGENGDPTYQIKVKCPICNQNDIACHELKAKSLTVVPDRFMAPRYQPVKGFRPLNYGLAAVTVCPSCLFASPDKRDFVTFSVQARAENKSQLGPFVLDELRGKVEERKMLLAPVSDFTAHFKQPRSVAAAIDSYRLSIHRALVEASLETPLSWYKAGMYGLRIALLQRDSGKADDAILKDSADYLAKSFRNSELKTPEMEYQLLYTLSALYLRIGDQAQCQAYLGVLDKTKADLAKREKEDPTVNTTHVEKWLERAKDLWTDREQPDLWKH